MSFLVIISALLVAIAAFQKLDAAQQAYYRGLSCRCVGDYEGAIAYYTQALGLKPKFALAAYSRANAWVELQKYDWALHDYNQALQWRPNLKGAHYNRANTKLQLGDLWGAIADYNRALQRNPYDAEAYSNRGYTLLKLGEQQAGMADLQRAMTLFLQQSDRGSYQKVQQFLQPDQTLNLRSLNFIS